MSEATIRDNSGNEVHLNCGEKTPPEKCMEQAEKTYDKVNREHPAPPKTGG